MAKSTATAPVRRDPSEWQHYDLWKRVREAILALPAHFSTATVIEGMLAPDIFTLNTALAATIEEQMISTLNSLRPVWDPDNKYQAYSFIRQSQTFPDVLLRKRTDGQNILLGIELKGWYLLAKEGEPNFRFPVAYSPFVESARYAAERRNHYWEHTRQARGSSKVILATGVQPYPNKGAQISDRAESDSGGNFGRTARYGVMEQYVQTTMETLIRGIPASAWLGFFKGHERAMAEPHVPSPTHGGE